MTRENLPAAQSAARRAASLLTGALMLAGLAGCGGSVFQGGSLFSANDSADAAKAKPAVALSTAEGVPQKYASKVDGQLAGAIKIKGYQIVDAKDAQYVIKVSYTASPDPKHGTKLAYTVDVSDKAGNKVRTLTGSDVVSPKKGGDPWSHVTEEGVQKVADKSAADLTAWLDNPNAPPPAAVASTAPAAAPVKAAAAKPAAKPAGAEASMAAAVDTPAAPAKPRVTAAAAPGEVAVVVPAVTGAPGDGKTALAEAMKRALTSQGIKLASSKAAAYKIQGQVEVGAAANGQQPITIRWVVIDPTGKQLEKTVVQNNRITAGSLDGTWGDIAEQAAGAAASEVSKLLQKPVPGQAQQGVPGTAG